MDAARSIALTLITVATAALCLWLGNREATRRTDQFRREIRRTARGLGISLDARQAATVLTWRRRQERMAGTGAAAGSAIGIATIVIFSQGGMLSIVVFVGLLMMMRELAAGVTPLSRPQASDVRVAGTTPRDTLSPLSWPLVRGPLIAYAVLLATTGLMVALSSSGTAPLAAGGVLVATGTGTLVISALAARRHPHAGTADWWDVLEVERALAAPHALGAVWLPLSQAIVVVLVSDAPWSWRLPTLVVQVLTLVVCARAMSPADTPAQRIEVTP